MTRNALASKIDHTVLGPETTPADAETVADIAVASGMNACIPPCYVADVRERHPTLTVVTVVGFPHGQHEPSIKRREAETAVEAGADEIDLVANGGRLLAGESEAVEREIATVVDAVAVAVKVIVEAPLLETDELRRACSAAESAGAAMVKTATGFADGGATVEDVATMAEYLPVKASGEIRTYDDTMAMLDAGAERIGTSSGAAILDEAPTS